MTNKPTRRGWLKGLAAALGGWVGGLAGRAAPPAAGAPVSGGPVTQIRDGSVSCRSVQTTDGTVTVYCFDARGRPPAAYHHDLCGRLTAITYDAPPPSPSSPG